MSCTDHEPYGVAVSVCRSTATPADAPEARRSSSRGGDYRAGRSRRDQRHSRSRRRRSPRRSAVAEPGALLQPSPPRTRGRMASHSLDCPLPLSQESDAPEQTPTSGCAPSRSRLARPVRSPQHQQPASCGSKDSPPTAVVITHPESGERPDKCSPSDEIHTPDRRQAPVRKARSCDPPARRRRRRRSRTSRRPGPRKSSAGAPGRGDPRARPCPGFGAWDDRGFALDAVKSQAGRVID
jgi:hypothetical protein